MKGLRIDIGPGEFPKKGCAGVDVKTGPGALWRCEWGKEPLPFADETVAEVYACHVLEHVEWYRAEYAIAEAYRVLKPGGAFTVHVPDFKRICLAYFDGKPTDKAFRHNPKGDIMRWVNFRLYNAAQEIDEDTPRPYMHRAVFDKRYLSKLLRRAGFAAIADCSGEIKHHGPMSLGLRAYKHNSEKEAAE
jgi:ubiquinone/menaquinone biosynthesis C-methylase UbiE